MWAGGKQALVVFDVVPQATVDLVAAGARAAATVAELAREAEIIGIWCAMIRRGAGCCPVRRFWRTRGPITVVLIHSTVKQESILEWHERGKRKSMHIIDASVTRATLPNKFCYMLGGDAALVDAAARCSPQAGNAVVHAGPVGAAIPSTMHKHDDLRLVHRHSRGVQVWRRPLHRSGNAASSQQHQWSDHAEHGWVHPAAANREAGEGHAAGAFGPHGALGKKDMAAALQSAKKHHIILARSTEDRRADCRRVRRIATEVMERRWA